MKPAGNAGLERVHIEVPDQNRPAVAGLLLLQLDLPRQFLAFQRLAFRCPVEFAGKVHGGKQYGIPSRQFNRPNRNPLTLVSLLNELIRKPGVDRNVRTEARSQMEPAGRSIECPQHRGRLDLAFRKNDEVDSMLLGQVGDQRGERLSVEVPEQEFGGRQVSSARFRIQSLGYDGCAPTSLPWPAWFRSRELPARGTRRQSPRA